MSKQNKKRDDFSQETLRKLAGRAGYMCSMPACKRLTVGPSNDRKTGLTNVGIGAHITAASSDGPRFDQGLTPQERSDESNGIWTCQVHGKDIDDNQSIYTVEGLKRIKKQHEDWVYARLANGPSNIRDGVTHLRISNIGPFRDDTEFKLGRLTVVLGDNGKGKTTLCQALAAFSGEPFLAAFLKRFNLGSSAGNAFIEAGSAEADIITKVRLTETSLKFAPSDVSDDEDTEPMAANPDAIEEGRRILISIDEAIAPVWPVGKFPIIHLHDEFFEDDGVRERTFKAGLQSLANQFQMTEDVIWNSLCDDFFSTTYYPCRFKRTGLREVEIALPDRSYYLEPASLTPSEWVRIILALATRLCAVDKRRLPWLVLVDNSFIANLDEAGLIQFLKNFGSTHSGLQLVVVFTDPKKAELARKMFEQSWLGASMVGALTVHAFL